MTPTSADSVRLDQWGRYWYPQKCSVEGCRQKFLVPEYRRRHECEPHVVCSCGAARVSWLKHIRGIARFSGHGTAEGHDRVAVVRLKGRDHLGAAWATQSDEP